MRYGIFADVHGNLPALKAVLRALQSENPDQYLCVGDIVGYGANPQECLDLVGNIEAISVAGNHEWGVLDKIDLDDFNDLAREALVWTQRHISREARDFLSHLDPTFKNKDLAMVHSTLPYPERFEYLTNFDQLVSMFPFVETPVCFVGHTHVPKIYVEEGSQIYEAASFKIEMASSARYIVNVGSIGQPRDGNPRAAYCVYSVEEKTIAVQRVEYDILESQRRIREAGLPDFLAWRLAWGI